MSSHKDCNCKNYDTIFVKDCVVKAQALTIEHLLGIIIKKLHASFEGKLMGVHVRIRKPEILTETKNLGVCATRFF